MKTADVLSAIDKLGFARDAVQNKINVMCKEGLLRRKGLPSSGKLCVNAEALNSAKTFMSEASLGKVGRVG